MEKYVKMAWLVPFAFSPPEDPERMWSLLFFRDSAFTSDCLKSGEMWARFL